MRAATWGTFALILSLPGAAGAAAASGDATATVASETDVGEGILAEQLTGSGTFGRGEEPPWSWNVSFQSRKATSVTDGVAIADTTNDFEGGLGWTGPSGWGISASVLYSRTAAESLEDRGSTLALSHQWTGAAAPGADFAPTFGLTLTGGTTNFVQDFSGTLPGRTPRQASRPIVGTNELRESFGALDAAWDPTERWAFQLGAKFYGFNRDVNAFEAYLNSPEAVQRGISGFSGTVSGIPSATYTANAAHVFVPWLKAALNESGSTVITTEQVELDTRATLEAKASDHWRFTAGYEYDWSPSTKLWDVILGVACDF